MLMGDFRKGDFRKGAYSIHIHCFGLPWGTWRYRMHTAPLVLALLMASWYLTRCRWLPRQLIDRGCAAIDWLYDRVKVRFLDWDFYEQLDRDVVA